MIYEIPPENFHSKFEVVSCFVEYAEKILLLFRQEHKNEPNSYGCPAGKITPGELMTTAMKRELFEETGISGFEPKFVNTVYVSYATYDFIYHTFVLRLTEEPKITLNPEEHSGFIWRTPENALKEKLIPDLDECVRKFYLS